MPRWMFDDTTATVSCPKCKAKAGVVCKTPSGKNVKGLVPHDERVDAFKSHPSFDITNYQAKVMSIFDLIAEMDKKMSPESKATGDKMAKMLEEGIEIEYSDGTTETLTPDGIKG